MSERQEHNIDMDEDQNEDVSVVDVEQRELVVTPQFETTEVEAVKEGEKHMSITSNTSLSIGQSISEGVIESEEPKVDNVSVANESDISEKVDSGAAESINEEVNVLTKKYSTIGNRELVAPLHLLRGSEDYGNKDNAKMVRLEFLDTISQHLKRSSGTRNGSGLPTTVAVRSKYILIGTSRGLILVFDHFQELRMILGYGKRFKSLSETIVVSETTFGPVSAIAIAPGCETFLCGFANGRIEYWDLERGSCVKVLADSHSNAITFLKFFDAPHINQSSLASSKKYTALSIDVGGVVMLLTISKMLMVRVVDAKCLLDGAAGAIVAFSNCEMADTAGSMVSLSTIKDTFMVTIQPTGSEAKVSYVWRLKGEDNVKNGYLPSTSWSRARLGEGRASFYTLARGWGSEIQFLQWANNGFIQAETLQLPEHYGTTVMALEWLQSSTLAVLNEEYELCIFDVVSMTMVEKISLKDLQLVWTSFSQNQHSFHSSFISKPIELRDGSEILKRNTLNENQTSLFLLGIKTLAVAKVQTWIQRVESLVSRGLWLQGLALALDQYELNGHRERNKMAEIILQYATSGNVGREEAGACIEYCLEIERTDVLFGTIYECFVNLGKHVEFLEVLEPYILNRLVVGMGPLVLKDFVEYYQSKGKIQEVEECITHLDPATIRNDLDTLVKLSKKYSLWAALIFLFNTGLNDWESPIRFLLKATDISSEVRVEMILKAMDAVNTDEELWESQVISDIEMELPQSEAVTISSIRLQKRSIPGGVSKEMVGKVLTRLLIEGEQSRMVKVLRNCDICMYNVDEISTHLKAYGWSEALHIVYRKSLYAAINSGQSLQRIEHGYLQVISTCTDPVVFCREQLSETLQSSHLVRQALRNAIVKSLKFLLRSSPEEACQLISAKESDIITDAAQLDDFPVLQYEYMKTREIQDHLLFIKLLAKLHPEKVYDYVSSNEGMYPLDETLQVCKAHNIKDATSYLLERTGDFDGALDLILECIDDMKTKSNSFEHAVGVAIQMCERNSITNLDTDQAQKMWFRLLEKLILSSSSTEAKGVSIGSDKDETSIALRNVLHSMMIHVESQNILKLIRSKPFGVLKKTVKAMIDAKYLENNMLKMASRLIANDMLHLVKAKHEKLNRATSMPTLSGKLTAQENSIENGSENENEHEHSSRKEGLWPKRHTQTTSWYTDWDEKLAHLGSFQLQLDPPF